MPMQFSNFSLTVAILHNCRSLHGCGFAGNFALLMAKVLDLFDEFLGLLMLLLILLYFVCLGSRS